VALAITTLPVSAQTVGTDTFGCTTPPEDTLHLDVANPGPGDAVPAGNMVIRGVAYDRSTTSDASVNRASLFLGDRPRLTSMPYVSRTRNQLAEAQCLAIDPIHAPIARIFDPEVVAEGEQTLAYLQPVVELGARDSAQLMRH
jgi:hypothetical protein